MVPHIIFFCAVVITAILYAKLETHIEGEAGWAKNLPTWRIKTILTNIFFPGHYITGYHLYFAFLILAMAHLPFIVGVWWGVSWEFKKEALILSYVFFLYVFEDFLYFVLNPYYGLKKFKREHIEWYKDGWFLIAPRNYWIAIPLAVVLYFLGTNII